MKHKIAESIRQAASFFCFLMGTFAAAVSLVLAYVAYLGHIPVWHPPAAILISMAFLTGSYLIGD